MNDLDRKSPPMRCAHCGNSLPLDIVGKIDFHGNDSNLKSSDPGESYQLVWKILMCPTCNKETITKRFYYSGWFEIVKDENGFEMEVERYIDETLYPTNKHKFNHLPATVAKAYEIALRVLPIEPIAFAVFIGKTLECLCKDKNATSRGLAAKIKDLAKAGIIPQTLADIAQQLAAIRNDGVHEPEVHDISKDDALLLRDLCETILVYVYEAPEMLKQVEQLAKKVKT
jgi:Domain of unknown function (DUF4145)